MRETGKDNSAANRCQEFFSTVFHFKTVRKFYMIHPVSRPSARFHFNQRRIIAMYASLHNYTFCIIPSSQSFCIKMSLKETVDGVRGFKNTPNHRLEFEVLWSWRVMNWTIRTALGNKHLEHHDTKCWAEDVLELLNCWNSTTEKNWMKTSYM